MPTALHVLAQARVQLHGSAGRLPGVFGGMGAGFVPLLTTAYEAGIAMPQMPVLLALWRAMRI